MDVGNKVVEGDVYKNIVGLASMCTDCEVERKGNILIGKGEATEASIVTEALRVGQNKFELYKNYERINEIPFDSKRKMMTTIR